MYRCLAAAFLSACAPKAATLHSFVSGPEGFDTASYWVDTGEEVVVFDAQFTEEIARALLADIREVTDHPVAYVVVTHPNPDKFDGAPVFQQEGAKLVASAATAEAMPGVHAYKAAYFEGAGMFAPGTFPALPSVDVTFEQELTLELKGSTEIVLQVLQHPGVTTTQTVAVVDGDEVIVGDLVAGGVHAWLEGGIVDGAARPDLQAWIEALDELAALVPEDATIRPGRGESGLAKDVLPAQQAYLRTMDELVKTYVDGLQSPMEELSSDGATHWAAITAQAEQAFPDYGLSSLVTYGVYGLAFSHAAP
jgi:glyoxylase-like metal-dependent hydrolase (beta-lactamase superfamily II)